jgi:hypothetical protein
VRTLVDRQLTEHATPAQGYSTSLTIPDWGHYRADIRSLWVSVLAGDPAWRAPSQVNGGRLAVALSGEVLRVSDVEWLIPGWSLLTYSVPVSQVSQSGDLDMNFEELGSLSGELLLNGGVTGPWVVVAVRSGLARVTFDGAVSRQPLTLAAPRVGTFVSGIGHVRGLPMRPRGTIGRLAFGPQTPPVTGASMSWPIGSPLDARLPAVVLLLLGVLDALVLVVGTTVLVGWVGTWPARASSETE